MNLREALQTLLKAINGPIKEEEIKTDWDLVFDRADELRYDAVARQEFYEASFWRDTSDFYKEWFLEEIK